MRRLLPLVLALSACARSSADSADAPAQDPKGSIHLLLNDPLAVSAPQDACEVELCKTLVQLIDHAQVSIDFAVYGMRKQTRVMEALRAAKERGVKLRGVIDRDMKGDNIYSGTDALVELVGRVQSDEKVDQKQTRKDNRYADAREPACERPPDTAGPVQCLAYDLGDTCLLAAHASREELGGSEAIMHNKFFVVDGRWVWTGSTNVSDSGTGGYNANLVTVVDSRKVAAAYTQEFEQMYTGGRFHTLKKSNGVLRAALGNADVEVMFSPQDSSIRRHVRPLLKDAAERIDIAVFFLTHKHITEDLIEAHKRGVKVRVILDATGATNGYTKHELLRAAGIPVKVENWGGKMHMKSAVIDGRHVITGSMNWTSAGEFSNDENTIIIHSDRHAQQYTEFFEKLWASIPDRWLEENPDPESRNSGTSCMDGSDNDFDGLVDDADPGCSDDPPPLAALPPWRIVPKGDRLSCEVGMDGA
jgi:phosphatidylserine/phosphatidylglycerophosphate/cardiolipin synthase-like enzyme